MCDWQATAAFPAGMRRDLTHRRNSRMCAVASRAPLTVCLKGRLLCTEGSMMVALG